MPAKLFQDATAANHPGNGFVVPALAEAAGVLHTNPQYVFMPDDPALGEFRKTFGGQPGTIEEYPLPGPDGTPGFAGAVEIVSTGELWARSLEGKARVDERALLRARLFDLWIAGLGPAQQAVALAAARGATLAFEPLPEDRDQAFSKFGGLLLATTRATHPKFMDWKDHYTNFEGWMTQGTEVDRWMLSEMDRAAFEATATDLTARLTDDGDRRGGEAAPAGVVRDSRRRSWPRRSRSGAPGSSRRRGSTTRASTARWTSTAPTGTTRRGSCGTPDGRLEVAIVPGRRDGALVPEDLRPARDLGGPALPLRRGGPRGDGGPGGRADHPARGGRARQRRARRLEERGHPRLRLRGRERREGPGHARGRGRPGSASPRSRRRRPGSSGATGAAARCLSTRPGGSRTRG